MEELTGEIVWITTLIVLLLCFGAVVAFMMDLFLNPKKPKNKSYEKIDMY